MVFGGILEFVELKQFWVMITFRMKPQEWLGKWRGGGGHL